MKDKNKTKQQLLDEVMQLRRHIADLEQSGAERKRGEDALSRLAAIVESSDDAIVGTTLDGIIESWNYGAERIYGYSFEEIRGLSASLLIPPDRSDETPHILEKIRNGGRVDPYESVRLREDRKLIDVSLTVSAIKDAHGQMIGASAISRDICERKQMEDQLRALSLTDELTGLYNRRGFFTLAEQEFKMAKRQKKGIFMLYVDLDGMKSINDSSGHQEGDRALKAIADILRETYRDSDIIARIGGDEFVVVPVGETGDNIALITSRLQRSVDGYNAKASHAYKLSLSIGIAHYNPESPCSMDELLAQADKSMYEQKRNKRES